MTRFAYLALAALPAAWAQIVSNARCSVPEMNWAFNSVEDSPCQVAAELAGVCNGGVFTLESLDEGFVYLGPSRAVQNSCRCNSVYYSMISACAACQRRSWINWDAYTPNCTTPVLGSFPQTIPPGTRVPAWAYIDIVPTNGFNVSVAQRFVDRPESTAVASDTASASASNTRSNNSPGTRTTSGTSGTPRSTNTNSNTNESSSGSNAGAIAGGVIGGIVGLALIAGLAFFFFRRRKQATTKPPSSAFNTTPYMPAPLTPEPHMGYDPNASPYAASQPQVVYNPSDPNTFPTTPAPASPYTHTTSPPPQNSSFYGSSTHVGQMQPQMPTPTVPSGHYTGAPEI